MNTTLDIQQPQIQSDDAKRFIEGFRRLVKDCNMSHVGYNCLGITRFLFKDGSRIGSLRLLKESGIIERFPDECSNLIND